MAGKTLLIDLLECDKETLQNPTILLDLLFDMPEQIAMTAITAPFLLKYGPPKCPLLDWGYTGGIIFAESHFKLHTWPEKGKILLDITSCKDFNHEFVLEKVINLFKAKDHTFSIVNRH